MSDAESTLVPHSGALVSVRRLANFSGEQLKRFAAKAVAERDEESLWELIEAQLTLAGASRHTLRAYRSGLRLMLEAFEGVNLLRVTRNEAQLFVLTLGQPVDEGGYGLSPASVRARVSAGSALYRALRWAGVTEMDPFTDVVTPKLTSRAKDTAVNHAIREEELTKMVRYAEEHEMRELLVIIFLGAHSGLRVSEMLNLKWSDVNDAELELRVREGKGGVDRVASMSRSLLLALNDWRQTLVVLNHKSEFVLKLRSQPGVYRALQRLWEAAMPEVGVPGGARFFQGRGVHGLRHYSGVRLARETGELWVVRDHLGHSSVKTTEIYAGAAGTSTEVKDW